MKSEDARLAIHWPIGGLAPHHQSPNKSPILNPQSSINPAIFNPAIFNAVFLALALLSAVPSSQTPDRSPRALLRSLGDISDAEWSAIERGDAVAKALDTDSREIAVAGAIRIAAPAEALVDRYRDIDRLKRSAVVLDAGRFSRPPAASDLARLPFEDYSLDLRDCRPADCRVRLSGEDVSRFHREVDWNGPDWRQRSAAVWREVLAQHAAAYARGGRRALPVFVNKRDPLSVPSELAALVEAMAFTGAYAPELYAYMRELAPPLPAGAEEIIYWSKEDFGIRPVLRLSHQVIARSASSPAIAIATNQIYADHYLDAALTVTLAIDASTASGRAFYLVSVSRARTRSLTGLLRTFVRSTVQSRSREALRKILTATKTGMERG